MSEEVNQHDMSQKEQQQSREQIAEAGSKQNELSSKTHLSGPNQHSNTRSQRFEHPFGNNLSHVHLSGIGEWLPFLQAAILGGGTLISFIMAYYGGHVSAYIPFLSETGANIPEMFVFSIALYLGSVIGIFIVILRYMVIRDQLSSRAMNQFYIRLNRLGAICGIVSMIGLAGVAAVPMSTILWLHLIFAGLHFSFAWLYLTIQLFMSHRIKYYRSLWWKNIQIGLLIFLSLSLLLLMILFPIAQKRWKKENAHVPALKRPDDPYFGIMLTTAMLEYMVYAGYLGVILLFWMDFRSYDVIIGVVPQQQHHNSTTFLGPEDNALQEAEAVNNVSPVE